MNREIKFRVWDKNKKVFIPTNSKAGVVLIDLEGNIRIAEWSLGNGDNSADSVYSPLKNQEDFVIQQYTGIVDNNKTQIFEGDIIKSLSFSKYVQEIEEYNYRIVTSYFKNEVPIDRLVVGNIFENPELLKHHD